MANFTPSQQLEISEFFKHLADARAFSAHETDDVEEKEMLNRDAELADMLAIHQKGFPAILNPIQLGKLVRSTFDDYEDVFAMMETYSEEMAEVVDAYWTHRLEQA